MDPLAHTLFGATLAETGLKKKTALATGTLIIGANIPDVDAVAMLISSDYALQVRRGWTHGILALMIWPFLLTGLMLAIDRFRHWRRHRKQRRKDHLWHRSGPPMRPGVLLALAFLGVWSHPLLDWLNTYGIRLLMPFSDTWFYGDTLFIIDPWVWLLTGAAVVLARSESWPGISGWIVLGTALTALVTTADMVPPAAKIVWVAGVAAIILARVSGTYRNAVQPVAITLLITVVLYVTVMFAGARMTAWHARSQLAESGIEVREVMANPQPARPLLRTGVAASENHYYRFRVNWARPGSFELLGDPVPIEEPDRIVEAALRSPEVQGLRHWMRFPAYEVRELDDGWRVFIRDLRYTDPGQDTPSGIGMAVVDLDEELQVQGPSPH